MPNQQFPAMGSCMLPMIKNGEEKPPIHAISK